MSCASSLSVVLRPAELGLLHLNETVKPLDDKRVREAIAHAIDKEALVTQVLPEGTEVASQFIPPVVNGYNEDVTDYAYDPDAARALLAEAEAKFAAADRAQANGNTVGWARLMEEGRQLITQAFALASARDARGS